ncbi:MAG: YesL family protein [Bacilli bacterium]
MKNNLFDGFFNWIYRVAYANVMWFGLTLLGGIVFGIFPATIALTELVTKWKKGETDLFIGRTMWRSYVANMKRGNIVAAVYYSVMLISGLNLFIALNQQSFLFLMIDFLLIFVMILATSAALWSVIMLAEYDVSLGALLKLSFGMNYFDLKNTFIKGMACFLAILITLNFPAMLMFGLAVAICFLNVHFSKSALLHLDQWSASEV